MPPGIVTNGVILRVLGETMRKFKRRQRHSLPFGLFLAVAGALLLPAAVAPRANAGSTDYWDSEDLIGSRPRPAPELFSQPQGVLINQPLAYNYNLTLASNVASGEQPGAAVTAESSGTNPQAPLANSSWTGTTSTAWSNAANWTAGIPGATDIASFDSNFTTTNQPGLTANTSIGEVFMTSTVTQNVTISNNTLTINGVAGTGILVDDSAFTLTIDSNVSVGAAQTWTNNSTAANPLTVSGNIDLK